MIMLSGMLRTLSRLACWIDRRSFFVDRDFVMANALKKFLFP